MSSTNKTTNYQLSQFVGTDIPSILNDYNGDMRKIDSAIHDATVAGGDNASAIAELQSAVGRHNTEISGLNSSVNTLSGKVIGIEAKIPDDASSTNKLISEEGLADNPTIEYIVGTLNGVTNTIIPRMQGEVDALEADVSENYAKKSDINACEILSAFSATTYDTFAKLNNAIYNYISSNNLTGNKSCKLALRKMHDIYRCNHDSSDFIFSCVSKSGSSMAVKTVIIASDSSYFTNEEYIYNIGVNESVTITADVKNESDSNYNDWELIRL